MADLAGLMERKVKSVGPMRGVGREDGVEVVRLCGCEAVRRIGFVGVGFAILPSRILVC